MYCKNCGNQIDDRTTQCPYCGEQVAPAAEPDNGGFWWGVLGCCFPIVGLILFLVWKDTRPNSSKAAGIGALVSVGISVAWYLIVILLGVGSAFIG